MVWPHAYVPRAAGKKGSIATARRRSRERAAKSAGNGPPTPEWIWKPIAALLVPIAVAAAPTLFVWFSSDRRVDQIVVQSAFNLLDRPISANWSTGGREWAIRVIERYSGVSFSEAAREELLYVPLPTVIPENTERLALINQIVAKIQSLSADDQIQLAMNPPGMDEFSDMEDVTSQLFPRWATDAMEATRRNVYRVTVYELPLSTLLEWDARINQLITSD